MREIYVIAHNMRSTFNVGSLMRTAEGMGVKSVYFTGYTPYPTRPGDKRLPHEFNKLTNQIHKTALGAEVSQAWDQFDDIAELLATLASKGVPVVALEQSGRALPLNQYIAPTRIALLLGEEVNGIPANILETLDTHLFIPMKGKKESFNVVIATAMALYQLRFN